MRLHGRSLPSLTDAQNAGILTSSCYKDPEVLLALLSSTSLNKRAGILPDERPCLRGERWFVS